MLVYDAKNTITAASGTATLNIPVSHGVIDHIQVTANTGTTTFDFKITNSRSVDFIVYNNNTGTMNVKPDTATRGAITVTIDNASVDEDFVIYISIIEKH